MKFATLALLGLASVAAQTITIDVDTDRIMGVVGQLEDSERQAQRDMEQFLEEEENAFDQQIQEAEDVYQTTMDVAEPLAEQVADIAMQKAMRDWEIVYTGLECSPEPEYPECQDPTVFFPNLLSGSLEACGCNPPVTVTQSNSKMACFTQGSDMACAQL